MFRAAASDEVCMGVRTCGATRGRRSWLTWDQVVSGGWLTGLWVLWAVGRLPYWVPLWYAATSVIAFAAHAADKAQAAAHGRRVPEQVLHLMSLAGGWPGALFAQRYYRHKTRKARFQVLFWGTVLAHVVVLVWYLA